MIRSEKESSGQSEDVGAIEEKKNSRKGMFETLTDEIRVVM